MNFSILIIGIDKEKEVIEKVIKKGKVIKMYRIELNGNAITYTDTKREAKELAKRLKELGVIKIVCGYPHSSEIDKKVR